MPTSQITASEKIVLTNLNKTLHFGFTVMQRVNIQLNKVRFKKQLLFLVMGAVQSYSESIYRLIEKQPYFCKASEVILRSIMESLINLNYVYSDRSQKNGFIFIIDSENDKIDFAKKHKSFWSRYPQWDMIFGDIREPEDWDAFIEKTQKELQRIKRKYRRYNIPAQLPDLRSRATIADNYLKGKNKLNENNSMEKYYVIYYKFFSNIAHLTISGLDRFFDKNNPREIILKVDDSPSDAVDIATITFQAYFSLLKFYAKEFSVYDSTSFNRYNKASKNLDAFEI